MRKLLIILLVLIGLSTQAQIIEYTIRATDTLTTEKVFVINNHIFKSTTQVNSNDTILVTLQYLNSFIGDSLVVFSDTLNYIATKYDLDTLTVTGGGGPETDPVYAVDSAKLIMWADTALFIATKFDIDTLTFLRNYSETDPVWDAEKSNYQLKSDTASYDATRYWVQSQGYLKTDANTTYAISAETLTGGANIRLTGSDATTDDVKLASGHGIDVTRTDANTITLSADTASSNIATKYYVKTNGGSKWTKLNNDIYYNTGKVSTSIAGFETVHTSINAKLISFTSNSTGLAAYFHNTSYEGNGLEVRGGSNQSTYSALFSNYGGNEELFKLTGSGHFRMKNVSAAPSNESNYGFFYFKNNTPYAYINSTEIDLTTGGGGSSTFLGLTDTPGSYSGQAGKFLKVNSGATALEFTDAPSGSSIWTDAGTYAHLNAYDDIYMPRGKSLSWRSTTADVSGGNTFRITSADASQLRIYAGSGDHEAVNIYNNNAAKMTAFSVKGNLAADLGASATYETDTYSLLGLAANGFNKFIVTGAGTFASVEQASSPGTPASGWGSWYNKTDGKPYFKNDAGTEYDLTAGTGGGSGTVTSVSAGNGMNFTTISTSGSVTMGTPSSITTSSTNGLTTNSHTHALDLSGRSVSTQHSLTGGGNLGSNLTLNLVNDSATPGNSKYYGTNASGTRGWYDVTSGGMTNPMTTAGDIIYGGASGTPTRLAAGTSGYVLTSQGSGNAPVWSSAGTGTVTSVAAGSGMNFSTITSTGLIYLGTPSSLTTATTNNVSGTTHTHALDLSGRSVSTQHSLTGGGNLGSNLTLNLVNDAASPGNSKYYGTNSGGTRGWFDLPTGGEGSMVYPGAGIAVSTGSAWGTSITDNSTNWNTAYNDKVNSAAFSGTSTKTLTLTQQDAGTVTASFTDNNTTFSISAETATGGVNLRLSGTDTTTDDVKLASGYGITVSRTDASTITMIADTSKIATQYDLTLAGGGSPGGSSGQLQYNNSGSFGGMTGSSVSSNNITFTGTVTASNHVLSSDIRLKDKISNLTNLTWTDKFNFRSFTMGDDRIRYGVIAQEVEEVSPELVYTDEKGMKSVAYIDLLVAKVARQDQIIKELIERIERLENEK